MKTTGERIKDIRLELGETLEEFGGRFNTSKATVFNWEKGRNLPNKSNLKKIAEIGDVSIHELIYRKPIGQKIKAIRKSLGLSQLEFSKVIGATKSAVNNWENGYNYPNNERLKVIAELGNTTVNQLLNSNPLSDYSTDELLQELERRGEAMKQLTSRQLDNYAKTSIDEYLNSGNLKHLKDASCIYHMFKLKTLQITNFWK